MVNLLRRREMMVAAGGGQVAPLYPFDNGTFNFTSPNSRSVEITNGNHFYYSQPGSSADASYINVSKISQNTTNAYSTDNINNKSTLFTIPANSVVKLEIKNISGSRITGSYTWSFGIRGTGTSTINGLSITGLGPSSSDESIEVTITSARNVGCLFFYARQYRTLTADIYLYIDGIRYI